MSDETGLQADVAIGLDVEAFFETSAGRRLIERLEAVAYEQIEALIEVDPYDYQEIQKLQNKIKWARGFKAGLLEMVQEGENAERELQQADVEE